MVVYRRLMVRIAERLAAPAGALALVTGESVGQVASQTLHNLARIDEAADLPVLRPLIGMDKLEITAQAHALGTYEISIEPDADCCTLFVPAASGHPRRAARSSRRGGAPRRRRASWPRAWRRPSRSSSTSPPGAGPYPPRGAVRRPASRARAAGERRP